MVRLANAQVPPSSFPSLYSELSAVDAALAALTDRRRLLETHRTSKAAFLPDDVLSSIFSQCIPLPMALLYGAPSIGWTSYASFSFSQVCQNWRRLALETPDLWSQPLLYNAVMATTMLERACDAPLFIIMNLEVNSNRLNPYRLKSERKSTTDAVLAVLKKSNHIVHLDIAGLSFLFEDVALPKTLGAHMPLLQQLHLRGRITQESQDTTAVISALAHSAPRLRVLQLVNVDVPWTSPLLGQLVRLVVSGSGTVGRAPSVQSVLTAFQHMKLMEHIHFSDEAIAASSAKNVRFRGRALLPRLQELGISLGDDISAVMLKHIEFTPTHRFLHCGGDRQSAKDPTTLRALFEGIRRFFAAQASWLDGSRRLHMHILERPWSGVASFTLHTRVGLAEGDTNPDDHMHHSTDSFAFGSLSVVPSDMRLITSCLAAALPMAKIGELSVNDESGHAPDFEGISLVPYNAASHLTLVMVQNWAFLQFLDTFCAPEPPSAIFPALQTLVFRYCDMTRVPIPREVHPSLGLPAPRADLTRLLGALRTRAGAGYRLRTLCFDSCTLRSNPQAQWTTESMQHTDNARPEMIKRFGKWVTDVQVTGFTGSDA
jgi:hypothetical protein